MENSSNLASSAAQKMATGSLMTLDEVAVRLSVSPMTVHRMPLPSIRLGRSLRFDPRDVERLIDVSREPVLAAVFGGSIPTVAAASNGGLIE